MTGVAGTTLAVTGGTGFIGGVLLDLLCASGARVRALTRKPRDPGPDGPVWIEGDLADADALDRLLDGAAGVIHLAGVIKGRNRHDFEAANVAGTAQLINAIARAGTSRLVHVSSLAARHPHLSDYAYTKAVSETLVKGAPCAWTIIRPPAVYGPGDRETLAFFKSVKLGLAPVPNPASRISLIYVDDLARALVAGFTSPLVGQCWEPDDGRPGGHALPDIYRAIARAMDCAAPRLIPVPGPLLTLAAGLNQLVATICGRMPMLSPGKARELRHPDWLSGGSPGLDWNAQTDIGQGMTIAAHWYRRHGWL